TGRDRRRALRRLRLPVHDRRARRRRPAPDPLCPRRGQQLLPRTDPQSQRGCDMDFEVSLAFENIHASGSASSGYGVDDAAVAQGLGDTTVRVEAPELLGEGLRVDTELMIDHQVHAVVEVILERGTNIAMGTALDAINEFD